MKLKNLPNSKLLKLVERLFIVFLFIVFAYSSINKILNYSYFNLILSQFPVLRFLPPQLIEFISLSIIITELVLGIGILIPIVRKPIALLGIILSSTFCIVTLIMIFKGEKAACGCFAPFLAKEFNFIKLYQNVVITILFATILFNRN